jgi:hypothetical protein
VISTIKLPNLKAVTIRPDRGQVALTVSVASVPAFTQLFSVEEAGALLAAFEGAAMEAETYRRALARAGVAK